MTIGEKIKKLRREQGITQEKLAEYLNISYQAVSKWENNSALPDISLVIPISNFFGVTTDVLFDVEDKCDEKEIEEYDQKSSKLGNKGKVRELIELWREAVSKYPRNYHCLYMLASCLNLSIDSIGFEKEESDRNAKEALEIYNRIIEDCTDDEIRANIRHQLVFLYMNTGDEEKAIACAEKAPMMHTAREYLLEYAYKPGTFKNRESKEKMALHHLYKFTAYITFNVDDPESKINAGCKLVELWNLLLGEENLLYQHHILFNLYSRMAESHCKLGNVTAALDCLKKAKRHIELYEAIPQGEHNYSGPYFSSCVFNKSKTARNYEGDELDLFKKDLENNAGFDVIRGEKEFADLLTSI